MLSILDTSERVGHHFSHKVIGLESRVFIVIREGLLDCSIVVAVNNFHVHVFKLVALFVIRLPGCASPLLNRIWPHFRDLDYALLVTVVLFDLKATKLLACDSIDFFVYFHTYWVLLVPRAH